MYDNDVVSCLNDATLFRLDMEVLKSDRSWMTDSIIHYHQELLDNHDEKIVLLPPSIVQLLHLGCATLEMLPTNVQAADMVLLPVNNNSSTQTGGSHWSLLILKQKDRMFYHLDSSHPLNSESSQEVARHLSAVLNIQAKVMHIACQQQNNNDDCGVFVMAWTGALVSDKGRDLTKLESVQAFSFRIKLLHRVTAIIKNIQV